MKPIDYFECLQCDAAWEMEHCAPAKGIYHNQPTCPICKSKYVKWVNYEEMAKKNFKA
jgi:hypothetical protein